MRGISTFGVLAIILIVIIVVALVGLTYSFSIGLFTVTTGAGERTTERAVTGLMSQARVELMSINDVIIRNIGLTDLSNFTVLINGKQSDFTVDPSVIEPEKLGTIKILDFLKERDEITILSSEGATITKKALDPCDEAVLCLSFDEGSGDIAYDSSGKSGNDGVINGSYWSRIIEEGKSWDLALADGFDDNDYNGWSIFAPAPGSVSVVNKELNVDAAGGDAYATRTFAASPEFVVDFNVTPVFDYIGGTYAVEISVGANYVIFTHYSLTTLALDYYVDGGIESSGSGNYPLILGQEYNIKLVTTKSEIKVYIDGSPELSITKTTQKIFNKVKLESVWADANFDDVKVYISSDTGAAKFGSALSFDGVDDYVKIPYDASLYPGTGSFTIEGWIKTEIGDNRCIISSNYSVNDGYGIWVSGDEIFLEIWDPINFDWVGGTSNIADGDWHHFAFVRDKISNKLRIFVDGIEEANKTDATDNIAPINSDTFIGAYVDPGLDPTSSFNGTIDEIRIYNKAIY